MSEFEQKVLNKLEEINQKLDKLLKGSVASAPAPSPAPAPTPAAETPSSVSPSSVLEQQKEAEQLAVKPPVEGRRTCPSCGGFDFNAVEDKTQLLSAMGGIKMYAKKYVCKKCGYEMSKWNIIHSNSFALFEQSFYSFIYYWFITYWCS